MKQPDDRSRRRFLTFARNTKMREVPNRSLNLCNAANVSIPAVVSVFPGENYQAPRSWTERAYNKLIYYNRFEQGGHYAAWEQPRLFSEEVRAGFRSLRSGAAKWAA